MTKSPQQVKADVKQRRADGLKNCYMKNPSFSRVLEGVFCPTGAEMESVRSLQESSPYSITVSAPKIRLSK